MRKTPVQVIKIGGSLLDLADLPRRLREWLGWQAAGHRVLIVGGGQLVDDLRDRHRHSPLDEVAAHWACIDLMGVNGQRLAASMPEIPHHSWGKDLQERILHPGATFFDSASFMHRDEATLPGTRLPASWTVTSDSIAGRLAIMIKAHRLILLKSALPSSKGDMSIQRLAERRCVDEFLPKLSDELPPVEIWNMRAWPPRVRQCCYPRAPREDSGPIE